MNDVREFVIMKQTGHKRCCNPFRRDLSRERGGGLVI
jgi:hypothetical protein